jgi:hypothetical protein
MKKLAVVLAVALPLCAAAQEKKDAPHDLRGVLLDQLKTTHDQADWFVPVSAAVDGLTAEQAQWKPEGKEAHSVGQLAYHLWFWDARTLARIKGEQQDGPPPKDNSETFDKFSAADWEALVKKLNATLADWDKAIAALDDATLQKNAALIAKVGAHRAYHVGQILYVRKLQGSWNPEKGVK